jgi:hypothetical protein
VNNTQFINVSKIIDQKNHQNFVYVVQYYQYYINFRRLTEYFIYFNQINLDIFKEK